MSGLRSAIASPDGAVVYSYSKTRSDLYVINGLKQTAPAAGTRLAPYEIFAPR